MTDEHALAPTAPAPDAVATTPQRVRRRGRRWVRLARGVLRDADAADPFRAALEAWTEVLPPGAVFTGLTAAALWGLWLPPLPEDLPVFVAVSNRSVHSGRPGIVVRRHPHRVASVSRAGLRVATVPELLLACAVDLQLLDLVVLIDSALHLGLCLQADVEAAAARRRRGAPQLRRALRWSDERSESPYESLLRVLHRACDVPVTPQVELRTADGGFVARADLLIDGTRCVQEYDGGDHLEPRRYRTDRRRDARLAREGYVRHAYVAADVLTSPLVILRTADEALGREHDPMRIHAWWALLRESAFSEAGMAALRRRWRLADGVEPAPGPKVAG